MKIIEGFAEVKNSMETIVPVIGYAESPISVRI
ncbi:Uncharacterised protein [Chryseobacterium indoltheticum]|uniref:Uncharacterized protein n=1 Tax=Chryseobacterium indoltheticum TaxID=254 RepID=A0A381FEX7_9FLAO|nr:Uncharacterised protein [Chryseobacterium indoltheticum]